MSEDLLIEADPATLEEIRREIEQQLGRSAELEPVMSAAEGTELREPVLIGLIIALGGKAVTKAVVDIIKRHYKHLETATAERNRHEEELVRLTIIVGDDERPTTLADLAGTA